MPTIITHGIFSSLFAGFWSKKHLRIPILLVCFFASFTPDLDVIGLKFGISHFHPFGHRGFTHSLFFAVFQGFFLSIFFYKRVSRTSERFLLFFIFFLATISHGFLDCFTNGGAGICFFCPFSNRRYFSPFRPILVSPIGADFFSKRGLLTLVSEAQWVWSISLILFLLIRVWKKNRNEN